jgi:hypothetical protein
MGKRKITCLLLTIVLAIGLFGGTAAFAADAQITVTVDGGSVEFDQPPIIVDGRTLVPIRAVCEKIGAVVDWDAATNTAHISMGDIGMRLQIGSQQMDLNDGTTEWLDAPPQVYGNRTLLPIRAVAENLGCNVSWDAESRTVSIVNVHARKVAGLADTQAYGISNRAQVSSVQQFAYKNEGLAYAYAADGQLHIITPSNAVSVEMKYPKLGDVLSNADGNFYVVWGRDNETDTAAETIFISKYTADGQLSKTTGFEGTSLPWGDDAAAKTKIPFHSGNCSSVIAKGVLVSYYAKQRYDGHQSDNVVAVNIADMTPYQLPNDTYSGHSFNQSVIYSGKNADFLFAGQGDAYARGFRVNDSSGGYRDENQIVFHFYMPDGTGYDMGVVNRTFAQLGGLAEAYGSVVLVGASAKSVGEAAKEEKQNLFMQIFDPTADRISADKFKGGETRTGGTYDRLYGKFQSFTDYGVHWLTNYTDFDAIAPQVVTAEGRIAILWSTAEDTYYTVISAEGETLVPTTSLDGTPLNSFERPIYYNGAVYWVAAKDGRLAVRSVNI